MTLTEKVARAQFDEFFNEHEAGPKESIWLMTKDTWIRRASTPISIVIKEAAKVAESYESRCDTCPRGAPAAILALAEDKP